MHSPFNERKAAQAAAMLLRLRGGRMSYLKLIKLLYLADRKSLFAKGRPITTDRFVSMDKGPVLSRVLDLITSEAPPCEHHIWRKFISGPQNYEVGLIDDPGTDELSRGEKQILQSVYDEHGAKSRWELVELTHTLEEWVDPCGSAFPITHETILKLAGFSAEQISAMSEDIDAESQLDKVLASYAS